MGGGQEKKEEVGGQEKKEESEGKIEEHLHKIEKRMAKVEEEEEEQEQEQGELRGSDALGLKLLVYEALSY
jgi:hypothetical protein